MLSQPLPSHTQQARVVPPTGPSNNPHGETIHLERLLSTIIPTASNRPESRTAPIITRHRYLSWTCKKNSRGTKTSTRRENSRRNSPSISQVDFRSMGLVSVSAANAPPPHFIACLQSQSSICPAPDCSGKLPSLANLVPGIILLLTNGDRDGSRKPDLQALAA